MSRVRIRIAIRPCCLSALLTIKPLYPLVIAMCSEAYLVDVWELRKFSAGSRHRTTVAWNYGA